ncbi:hypothetical protein QFZ20_002203 [Flavobacterium sp. W4I14]|nr:hypothetical protein [Flavobacterium sp. W4I14]
MRGASTAIEITVTKPGAYSHIDEPLSRAPNGLPAADAEAIGVAHTQLGNKIG